MEDLNSESSIREIEQTDDHFDQSSYDPTANKFTKKAASKDDVMTVKREADIQAGGYALEAAACTYGTRLFIHGIIIADDNLEFWYYDSSGYLRTKQTLSLFTDFCMVAAIIVGFARGDAAQWGALPPVISPPSSKSYPAHFPPKSLEDHSFDMTQSGRKGVVRVTLKTPIFSQYSLVGRRTFLYDIETSSIVADTPLVVKMSYQVVGRMPEHKILAIAHKAKVGHLPKAHMWKDLWKLSDGVRQIFYERSKELSETGDDIATYEDRVLRALVYTKYLPIKTLFSKSVKFIPLMVDQMLDCLHDLRHKANILHRDISCHNIMYEMRDGDPYFILIDYDLAKVLGTGSEPSISLTAKHRTGTLPFMAHELLLEMVHKDNTDFKPKVIHRLRHEYESLFNVALWSSITMPVVKNRKQKEALLAHARLWESGTVVSVATFKYTMVTNTSLIDGIPLPPNAEYLRNYFKIWVLELSDGYQALQRYKSEMSRETIYFPNRRQPSRAFDLETMDGIITRDHLKAALAPCNVLKTSTGTINAEIPLSKSTGRGESRASAPKKSPRSSKVTAATRSKADTTKKTSTIRKVNTAQKSQRAKSPKRSSPPPRVVKPSGRAASVAKNIAPVMTRVTRSMAKKA
ncbi:hypothetical protein PHLCEN_2v11809 [Hermanssonia centrifuga]|uniref:Fungal-type protein kinase domain-containing protein n=1 Tax=Hermanssonia centrifuga TaxID=98765 RepID=A0A2R6NIV1_9APHY|nr:hypothetical protein PHLCEN_2v11809 [Hermanssonia centrifuga]